MSSSQYVSTTDRVKAWMDPDGSTLHIQFNNPARHNACLLYTSPSPRDRTRSRMPSSA